MRQAKGLEADEVHLGNVLTTRGLLQLRLAHSCDSAIRDMMGRLSRIQVLRGLAALAVVVFHARDEVSTNTHLPSFVAGAFGVDLFFVISGFVMLYASAPLFGTWRSAITFIGKRLTRIVPLYWVVTVLFAVYVANDPDQVLSTYDVLRFLVSSLFFVPYLAPFNDDAWPIYPLGWTLDYEMFFYLCFAAVIVLTRTVATIVLTVSFIVLVVLKASVGLPSALSYLASSQILEFVAGVLIAQLFLDGWTLPRPVSSMLILASLAIVLLSLRSINGWWAWRGIVWGVPAAAIVGATALRPARAAEPARGWFERLGDASYALYLIHYGLYRMIEAVLSHTGDLVPRLPTSIFMLLLIVSAVALSFVVHLAFEVPMTRALQRRLPTWPRQAGALRR